MLQWFPWKEVSVKNVLEKSAYRVLWMTFRCRNKISCKGNKLLTGLRATSILSSPTGILTR